MNARKRITASIRNEIRSVRRVSTFVASGVLLIAGTAGLVSTTASAAAKKTVYILAVTDSSGPTKQQGSQELIGLDAAARFYNAHGGIGGRKVVITHLNDNGDPATAASVTEKALSSSRGKYAMVYGGEEGTDIDALIPVLAKYPVIAVALNDSGVCNPSKECPHEFSLEGAQSIPQSLVAQWMKSKGYKHAGILEQEISFTQSETTPLVSSLGKSGIANTVVTFPSTAVSLTTEAQQLQSAGSDVIYAEALGPSAGYALSARASLGWNVPVLMDVAGSSIDLSTLVSSTDLANTSVLMKACADKSKASLSPGFSELAKYASPLGGMGDNPCNLAGAGWDSVVLLHQLVAQTGSFNYKTLTNAAEHVSAKYVSSPNYVVVRDYKFSASDHENLGETTKDWSILPAGQIVDGQIKNS